MTLFPAGVPEKGKVGYMGKAKVYFTKEITPQAMVRMYEAMGVELPGKVAVKVHSGEVGNQNFLRPDLMKPVIDRVRGTIVECNTAYEGKRNTTQAHRETMKLHGWADIAEVDILDADGEIELSVPEGQKIQKNYVGRNITQYESMLVLSHFKGHAMAGFGGAIKNISIGLGSSEGKCWIHSAGTSRTSPWGGEQDPFLESMGEAGKSVVDALDGQIVYINVMNRLSVDCDCDGNPAEPDMHDIGILASTDPVALDQACIDLVYAAEDGQSLINRIESRNGLHTLEHAEEIGLGSRTYELVSLDD